MQLSLCLSCEVTSLDERNFQYYLMIRHLTQIIIMNSMFDYCHFQDIYPPEAGLNLQVKDIKLTVFG